LRRQSNLNFLFALKGFGW